MASLADRREPMSTYAFRHRAIDLTDNQSQISRVQREMDASSRQQNAQMRLPRGIPSRLSRLPPPNERMNVDQPEESQEDLIQIFIKPHHSTQLSTFTIRISLSASIDELRHRIYLQTKITPNRLRLTYRNRILRSGDKLSKYNLSNDCTIEAIANGSGGGRGWFEESRGDIDVVITTLNERMAVIHNEQDAIEKVSADFIQMIQGSPTLRQLNQLWMKGGKECGSYGDTMHSLSHRVLQFEDLIRNGRVTGDVEEVMSSLETLINNTVTSVDHEEKIKTGLLDTEMVKKQAEIRKLEDEYNELQSQKAKLQSVSHQQRKDLKALRTKHVKENRQKLARLGTRNSLRVSDLESQFKKHRADRIEELERESADWDTDDLLTWIQSIESGHFDSSDYTDFLDNIRREKADGDNLPDLANGMCLRMFGLGNDRDIELLTRNLHRLLRMNMDNDFIVKGNRCCACLSKCIECVISPCGHQPYCYDCAVKAKKYDPRCPICRTHMNKIIRSFIAGV